MTSKFLQAFIRKHKTSQYYFFSAAEICFVLNLTDLRNWKNPATGYLFLGINTLKRRKYRVF